MGMAMWKVVPLLVSLLFAGQGFGEIIYSLDSSELDGTWQITNGNGSITTEGRVPGGIYSDLMASNSILNGSIFYRNNDLYDRWVGRENWTYWRNFDLNQTVLDKKVINLVLYGVDTVADIYLNGQLLGSSVNMFHRHIFHIKGIAQLKNNTLEVKFQSPVLYAENRYDENPIPPSCVPDEYQGECHANMIRKMQASFSWDWGPSFPSVGLWKSAEIEAFDVAVVRDILVSTSTNGSHWFTDFTYFAESADDVYLGARVFSFKPDPRSQQFDIAPIPSIIRPILNNNYTLIEAAQFVHKQNEVNTWWPNGFGEQPLYSVSVQLKPEIGDEESSEKTVHIGFRTIELVQDPVINRETGLTFYFKVNGVPIFAKGSNWIPGHILPELGADREAIEHLLLSTKEANMNMLRVWGGGVYESDLFYQIADELGILIWQDMMFASSMYPATPDELESAGKEAEYQVKRLQHHPSIAIWSGNNENEANLVGNTFGTDSDFERFKADYISLYAGAIVDTLAIYDQSRPIVYSSPSNGEITVEQGFVADNPSSAYYGDMHYYNYDSDGWNSYSFPDTRFASEFGYQSMCSFASIKEVSEPEDWSLNSEFSQRRQHHPGGNSQMAQQIRLHLNLPEDDGTEEYYRLFIYYSQISQGVSTKTETEKYRRDRSKLTNNGLGLTMGALYWQLNDVWQGPTWSSIELNGRWKLLHYLAKKFFAPILISADVSAAGEVNVHLISDLLEDVTDLEASIYVHTFDSFDHVAVLSTDATLKNATSSVALTATIDDLLSAGNCAPNQCFFHFVLSSGSDVLSQNFYFSSKFYDVVLPRANITVNVLSCSTYSCQVGITSDAIAPFLWLETDELGVFSDNGFILMAPNIIIDFETRGKPISAENFSSTLTVRALGTPLTKAV